jgi:hypothetical protein
LPKIKESVIIIHKEKLWKAHAAPFL